MAEGEAGGAPQERGMSEIQWTVIGVGVALLVGLGGLKICLHSDLSARLDAMHGELGGQIDEMRGSVDSVLGDFGRLGEGAFEEAE